MGLSLRGATSGAIDINPPAVAGDNTITLPPDNGSANQFFKNSGTAGIVTFSSMTETSAGDVGVVGKLEIGPSAGIACTISSIGAITAAGSINSNRAAGSTSDGFAVRAGTKKRAGINAGAILQLSDDVANDTTIGVQLNGITGAASFTGTVTADGTVTAGTIDNSTNYSYLDKGLIQVNRTDNNAALYVVKNGTAAVTLKASGAIDANGRGDFGTTTLNDYAIAGFTSSALYGGFYAQNDNTGGNLYTGQADGSEVFKVTATGDTTIRDLTARTVTSSDQVISNRSGTSVCFRAQSSGTDNLQILANGKVQSGSDYTAGDGVNIFAGGSIYIRQDGTSGGVLRIRNGADYKIELKGDGGATFAGGNVVIDLNGAMALPGPLTCSGSVKIGGTASANQIDEYEEGTWSPTIGGTATYDIQWGYYIKIGKSVQCWGGLRPNSMGTGNARRILNLPFTVQNSPGTTFTGGGAMVWFDNSATSCTNTPSMAPHPNETYATINLKTSATGTLQSTHDFWQNNNRGNFFINYQTD